jgi:hypothetical protein
LAVAQSFTFGPGGAYTATWDGVSTLTVTLTSGGAFVASFAGQNLAQVTASPEFMQLAASALAAPLAGLALQAATPLAGFALQNATPNILTWTAPADGQQHRVLVLGEVRVTSAQTGGAIGLTFTYPDGSASPSASVNAGGSGTGYHGLANSVFLVAPGTTVTLAQTSAQSAGAAILYAELWGS